MEFYLINLVYIAIWIFNIYAYLVARSINDFYSNESGKRKIIQFLFNHQSTVSDILKLVPILLIVISIVLIFLSIISSLETTQWMISIYFVISIIDLLFSGLIMTLYKEN